MRVVKAAAVQMSPVLYSREATVAKVARKIHDLGQQGVQFAQSPVQNIAGPEQRKLIEQAVTVPSPATPLARYAMMADGEQIHSAMYPGSIFGELFAQQTETNVRQHALESGCFVVTATAWLDPDQQA